jgi:hypothetical protein
VRASVMSARRKNITVFRNYQPVPEDCSKALSLLLEAPVRKLEAAHPAAPKDDVKESNGYVATPNHNR